MSDVLSTDYNDYPEPLISDTTEESNSIMPMAASVDEITVPQAVVAPYAYKAEDYEHINLSDLTINYEITAGVVPGQNGFDFIVGRRFDSHFDYVEKTKDPWGLPSIKIENWKSQRQGDDSHYTTRFKGYVVLDGGRSVPFSCYGLYNPSYPANQGVELRIDQYDQTISHPVLTRNTAKFDMVAKLKDGTQYLYRLERTYDSNHLNVDDRKVSRLNASYVGKVDRFGNMIMKIESGYYDMNGTRHDNVKGYIDSWGQIIENKSVEGFDSWIFPDGSRVGYGSETFEGESCGVLVDQMNRKTRYKFRTQASRYRTYWVDNNPRNKDDLTSPKEYSYLSEIIHPTGARTKYTYGLKHVNLGQRASDVAFRRVNTMYLTSRYDEMPDGTIKNRKLFTCNNADIKEGYYTIRTKVSVDNQNGSKEVYHLDDAGRETRIEYYDSTGKLLKTVDQGFAPYSYPPQNPAGTDMYKTKYFSVAAYYVPRSRVETWYENGAGSGTQSHTSTWEYTLDGWNNVAQEKQWWSGETDKVREVNFEYDGNYSIVTKKSVKTNTTGVGLNTSHDEICELHSSGKMIREKRIVPNIVFVGGTTAYERTEFVYDSQNRLVEEKRYGDGGTGSLLTSNVSVSTKYEYGSAANPHPIVKRITRMKDVDGNALADLVERYEYDAMCRVICHTDPNGNKKRTQYDALGRVTKEWYEADNYGKVTAYNDTDNHITVQEFPNINANAATTGSRKQFDALGNLIEEYLLTPPIFIITAAEQDAPAPMSVADDKFLFMRENLVRTCVYDDTCRLTEERTYGGLITAVKSTTSYTYDLFDRVLTKAVAHDGVTERESHSYNDAALYNGKRYLLDTATVSGDSYAESVVTRTYTDSFGQARVQQVGDSAVISEYDLQGNCTGKTDANGNTTTWRYDYVGRVTSEVDALGNGSSTAYDPLGNKVRETDRMGGVHQCTYDNAGRLIKRTSSLDSRNTEIRYWYDGAGNLTRQDSRCGGSEGENLWRKTMFSYDNRNRQTEIRVHNGAKYDRTCFVYDTRGNKLEVHTGLTENASDAAAVTSYTYDHFNNVLTMTDPRSNKLKASQSSYPVERCQYDTLGKLTQRTDRNGTVTTYQYDGLDRLTTETATTADGIATTRSHAYALTGQKREEKLLETGVSPFTTSFYYDNRGLLKRQSENDGAVVVEKTYTWDAAGNRKTCLLKRGSEEVQSLWYGYDACNRLQDVRKSGAGGEHLVHYGYDANGNQTLIQYPSTGLETAFAYNKASLIDKQENKRNGTVLSSWSYAYWLDGNQRFKTDRDGNSISYTYDYAGRLIEERDSKWNTMQYEYDRFSNRSRMVVSGGESYITEYQYHDNNWLLKETKTAGTSVETICYEYDAGGSQLRETRELIQPGRQVGRIYFSRLSDDIAFLQRMKYNGFGQMISLKRDAEEIRYRYRPDGLRHSKTMEGVTTTHLWDGDNIVAEWAGNGNRKAVYYRGNGLLAQEIDNLRWYYQHNAHGDVIQRIQANGTASPQYRYDAFGNQIEPVEPDPNPFRYCGEYWDGESKTYYLRARSYNPRTGRFSQEDPIQSGLNWYSYCGCNPLGFVDPSGLILQSLGTTISHARDVTRAVNKLIFHMIFETVRKDFELVGSALWGATNGAAEVVLMTPAAVSDAATPPNQTAYGVGRVIGNVAGTAAGALTAFFGGVATAGTGGAAVLVGSGVATVGGAAVAANGVVTTSENLAGVINMALSSSTNSSGSDTQITIEDKYAGHIFRDSEGHFIEDNAENRQRLIDLVNNKENYLGTDSRGNDWYGCVDSDGQQIWASVRGREIRNGGINKIPKIFSSESGLSSPVKPS